MCGITEAYETVFVVLNTSDSGFRWSCVKQFLLSFYLHLPGISLCILLFLNFLNDFDLDMSLITNMELDFGL